MRDRLFRGLGVGLSALMIGLFAFLPLKPTHAENSRVITVYYDGKEQTVVTDAPTVGDVLNRAGIELAENDLVEPGTATLLSAPSYDINVYRARPVTVVDGTQRSTIVTAHTSARQIVKDAGIDIHDEDLAEISRIDEFIAESGVGLKLTIDRATTINLVLYGKQQQIRTQAETVGELMQEKGLVLGEQDGASQPAEAPVVAGMTFEVWRDGVQTLTVEESIAFKTELVYDVDKPVGYKELRQAGRDGKQLVTYELEMKGGKEVGRKKIQTIEVEHGRNQIEVVGAKGQYTTPTENENITWEYLIGKGFSRVQTAGIMGNIRQESNFKTAGDGIVQWTGARKAALYAKPNPTNIYTQLDFLMEELNGKYAHVRDAIKADSSPDPTNVVIIFQNKFEKCGLCMESKRIQYARNILVSH